MTMQLSSMVLCLIILIGAGAIAWAMLLHLRDRRDAREVVPLEAAVCILKENGDIIIRQQRGKSALGLMIGLLLVLGSLAGAVSLASKAPELKLEALCTIPGLLILGALVIWVSTRAFREPQVAIKVDDQTVEIRTGLPKCAKISPFSAIECVVRQSQIHENFLFTVSQLLISPQYSTNHDSNRTLIGLQYKNGQVVQICTTTREAANRVPSMIATAIGKPVLTK